MTKTTEITVTPDLPYFAALADCDYAAARIVARNEYEGDELAAHLAAIDEAEDYAATEATRDAE